MNIKQHHTSKALPFLMLALLALLFIPSFVSSNPSAATDSRSHVPSSRHKPKLWGVVPKLIDSSIPKHIIVMGGPASGKGTQCQNLADKYGLVHCCCIGVFIGCSMFRCGWAPSSLASTGRCGGGCDVAGA